MTMIIKYVIINSIQNVISGIVILMKKSYKSYIFIFSALFMLSVLSCKNNSEPKLVYADNDTIKQSVKEREQGITWTQELEKERLTEKINRSSMQLGSEVPYNKEIFKISKKNREIVYPEFEDFGSLDTRNIRSSLKEKLNNFCKSLSSVNHNGAESYFSKKYIFNYVFFVKDLEDGWKSNFGQDYPKPEKAAKVKDSEEEEDALDIFTKWTFGEPFIGSEIMQIPVRFYSTCGIIDVTVFLNSSGNNEFYQITINRWKKV